MVNQYIWEIYLKSGGSDIVKTFETNFSDPEYFSPDYAAFIKELRSTYTPMQWLIDDEYNQLENLYDCNAEDDEEENSKEEPDKELLLDDLIGNLKQINGSEDKAFSAFIYDIAFLTTDLTICAPDLYIPYYFRFNFNVLQIIADIFDIELPPLPKKSDYNARFMYYAELCNVLHSFREQNGWTPYELFAFLYDFAPKYIGGTSSYIISDLPQPKGAYFIGGSKDDIFLSDSKDEITIWQCSPETKAGDMIVMYLRSPVSAVDSVWRSCSLGFVDPFFYYYRCTYICYPLKLERVGIEEMRSDEIIGSMPIVKKNMQGLNGIELKPSEYNHLLDLGHSDAMRLEYSTVNSDKEYSTEKEVEDNVIKPLLAKIGYDEADYVQQLYLDIGNHNHALIPDFVLLPESKGNNKSAFAVVEAKRSITNSKELNAAKSQVRSYAKLLGTKYAAIVSQEKIWVFSSNDDYSNELFSCAISELTDDSLYELKKIIGK